MAITLFVGTVKGAFIYRSDDRKNWRMEGPLFKGWKVTAADRTPSGVFLVGTTSYVYGASVHRGTSLDSLEHVVDGPAFEPDSGRKLEQIWKFHSDGDLLLAGVSEAGLFSSTDEGKSWHPVSGLNDHESREGWYPGFGGMCTHAILVDPENKQRQWCGISAVGVFRTDDGGTTWQPRNEGVEITVRDQNRTDIGYCVHGLAADPSDASIIYRQDHMGMYRTSDGGDSWERNQNGLPSGFGFPIAIDPATSYLFAFPQESSEYRAVPDGRFSVYRSTDRGESWHACEVEDKACHAQVGVLRGAMAVDKQDPCGVYLGTTSGTVHMSADLGESWQRLPGILQRILCVEVFID